MSHSGPRVALLAVLLCAASGAVAGVWVVRSLRPAEERPEAAPVAPVHAPVAASSRRAVGGPDMPARPVDTVASDDLLAKQNNAAIEALEAGDLERAIGLFEACHRAEPQRAVFARNLAEALARQAVAVGEEEHPCATCVDLLTRALELAPDRKDIAELLEHVRRELALEKDFWRESSQHFDLAYDGDRNDILFAGNRLLNQLEDHYLELERFFGASPVDEGGARIKVSLYRREGFDELTGLGEWAGGAYDGVVRIPIGDFAREEHALDGVMRHELAHAFVRAVGGRDVPGWLNEGLAQWLEPNRDAALAAARAKISGAELFPLERLAGSLATMKDTEEISRAYAQSLVAVDALERRFGETMVLDLLRGSAAGVAPAETFSRATRLELDAVIAELLADR